MTTPSPRAALLARIDRAEASSWERGLHDVARALPEAPVETRVLACGLARAFITESTHVPMFNRVLAMTPDDLPHLEHILAFFAEHTIPPRFDLCPESGGDEVASALFEHGLSESPGDFHKRRLFVAPGEVEVGEEIVEVRPLTRDLFPSWLAIDEAVWPGKRGDRRAKLEATFGSPRYRRFLAFIDGEPVALGRLEIIDGVAMLNGAGTIPERRTRGCQRSLTTRRVRVAKSLGCDVITALVTPGSRSEKNLIGSGLVRQADREIWQWSDWALHSFYRR